ncbi:HupE/UreJ family protein [Streptomyces sp. NPDC059627]
MAGDGRDNATQVGVIRIDTRTMTIAPPDINLEDGSIWSGTCAMFRLGAHHISGRHRPSAVPAHSAAARAPDGRRKPLARTESTRTAVGRIGHTTLEFTVGHSVALAVSAFGRLDIPAQQVEAFIALSILVGAVHAIRPLFPGREAVVAGVFGLGHGPAFSLTLAGFNPGIECMQLVLVTGAVLATLRTAAPRGPGHPRRSWWFAHRS